MRVEIADTGEVRDAVSHDLVELITRDGHQPVLLSNALPRLTEVLDDEHVSAIVLSGGADIIHRNAKPEARELALSRRDDQERALIDLAVTRGMPLIGICRGFQLINDYFGGSLVKVDDSAHRATSHPVRLQDDFFEPFAAGNSVVVNSFHLNAVLPESLGPGLAPLAFAEDGSIEAARAVAAPVLGVMWHPERRFDGTTDELHSAGFIERMVRRLTG